MLSPGVLPRDFTLGAHPQDQGGFCRRVLQTNSFLPKKFPKDPCGVKRGKISPHPSYGKSPLAWSQKAKPSLLMPSNALVEKAHAAKYQPAQSGKLTPGCPCAYPTGPQRGRKEIAFLLEGPFTPPGCRVVWSKYGPLPVLCAPTCLCVTCKPLLKKPLTTNTTSHTKLLLLLLLLLATTTHYY